MDEVISELLAKMVNLPLRAYRIDKDDLLFLFPLKIWNNTIADPSAISAPRSFSTPLSINIWQAGLTQISDFRPPGAVNCTPLATPIRVKRRRIARLIVRPSKINTKQFNDIQLVGTWRMGSNPRCACVHGGFQDRCLKPLGHPSEPLILTDYRCQ
jgi:hypothetical protein